MKQAIYNSKTIFPKNQLKLFGYDRYFDHFIKLFHANKFPNTLLLSGPKGSGKATFAFHFINYLLSFNEAYKYSVKDFTIDSKNASFKKLLDNIHPNFISLENNKVTENINIESVRSALKFLNKTTYSSNIKIVLIDNVENLNIHSSNALLKVLEEADSRTFFIMINDSSTKILRTIKSRSIEFKIFFSIREKKSIFKHLCSQYEDDFDISKLDDNFYFESPGNLLNYLFILRHYNIDFNETKLSCLFSLIDAYKLNNDTKILSFITLLVELFYNELSNKNNTNLNTYFAKKYLILNKISQAKKFNLDKKNLLISIKNTLENEQQ